VISPIYVKCGTVSASILEKNSSSDCKIIAFTPLSVSTAAIEGNGIIKIIMPIKLNKNIFTVFPSLYSCNFHIILSLICASRNFVLRATIYCPIDIKHKSVTLLNYMMKFSLDFIDVKEIYNLICSSIAKVGHKEMWRYAGAFRKLDSCYVLAT